MQYTHDDLRVHLALEHDMSPFSTYLKEIVYGGNDGIVTTFAVVAGFTGASAAPGSQLGYLTVLLFGLANLAADATSMGLGNMLSMRSEQERYLKEKRKEMHEINENPQMEKAETQEILISQGFSKQEAVKLVEIYAGNHKYWSQFMMQYELEMSDPTTQNPFFTGIATFLSFVAFGFIPLVPYIFFKNDSHTFFYASLATLVALVLLGLLRWRITRSTIAAAVGEIVLVGGLSAAIAFMVGTFFKI